MQAHCVCHEPAVVARLESEHTIEWFSEGHGAVSETPHFVSAHDFVWKRQRRPFDLTVYELGDLAAFAFVWPYLVRYPGLVLLHDGRLHASRGSSLLRQIRVHDYRAEFAYNHPDISCDVPRLAHAELLGLTAHLWPMRRVVVESSRLLTAPSPWVAADLRQEASHDRITLVEPGVPIPSPHVTEGMSRWQARERLGVDAGEVAFTVLADAPERCPITRILSAFAQLGDQMRHARLFLCGQGADRSHAAIRRLGLQDRVTVRGPLDRDERLDQLAASDVCVCLEWPDRSDGTRSWLDAMAAGKPTIAVDLAHRVDIPSLDPRDWKSRSVAARATPPEGAGPAPVFVTIDIVDEEHSLKLSLRRLVSDNTLRSTLGKRAKRLCATRFSVARLVDAVDDAVRMALDIPSQAVQLPQLPRHLLDNGTGETESRLERLGLTMDLPRLSSATG